MTQKNRKVTKAIIGSNRSHLIDVHLRALYKIVRTTKGVFFILEDTFSFNFTGMPLVMTESKAHELLSSQVKSDSTTINHFLSHWHKQAHEVSDVVKNGKFVSRLNRQNKQNFGVISLQNRKILKIGKGCVDLTQTHLERSKTDVQPDYKTIEYLHAILEGESGYGTLKEINHQVTKYVIENGTIPTIHVTEDDETWVEVDHASYCMLHNKQMDHDLLTRKVITVDLGETK